MALTKLCARFQHHGYRRLCRLLDDDVWIDTRAALNKTALALIVNHNNVDRCEPIVGMRLPVEIPKRSYCVG